MDSHDRQVMFSSEKTDWATPQILFDKLNEEFSFTLDVCAIADNAKCPTFFTPEDNGLVQPWTGVCWMNPPYNEPEQPCKKSCKKKKCQRRGCCTTKYIPGQIDFLRKAHDEVLVFSRAEKVVCLIPSRTDTKYFHDYCMRAKEIRFIEGRLKFQGAKDAAPFPSALIIFQRRPFADRSSWPIVSTYNPKR